MRIPDIQPHHENMIAAVAAVLMFGSILTVMIFVRNWAWTWSLQRVMVWGTGVVMPPVYAFLTWRQLPNLATREKQIVGGALAYLVMLTWLTIGFLGNGLR